MKADAPPGRARRNRNAQRGSLILLVMCLLAVLGIALAGYLAVSNQAMKLANRSYAKDVSKNLAEMGLERALLSFTTNNWSGWTKADGLTPLTSTDTTAYRTISFANTKYGISRITGVSKIRVDNFNAYNKPSVWNSTTTYKINDVVSYNSDGQWYSCVRDNTNQTPGNLSYWVPAQIPWKWGTDVTYALYDVVNYAGIWYRCVSANTGQTPSPSSTTYWTTIPSSRAWVTGTAYALYDVVSSGGVLYRCTAAHTSSTFATDFAANRWSSSVVSISPAWTSSTVYTRGALVYSTGNWFYCTASHTSSSGFSTDAYSTNPAVWECITSWGAGSSSYTSYSASTTYMKGDYVYVSPNWYRYINSTPASGQPVSNGAYWNSAPATSGSNSPNTLPSVNYPFFSWSWIIPAVSGSYAYTFNDLVYNSGNWYRCTTQTPTWGAQPPNTSYWENALTDSWDWDSLASYHLGDVVNVGGSFYRCILAHSGRSPPSYPAYWSVDPLFSPAWDPGKLYSLDDSTIDTGNDVVSYNGNWYLYINATPSAGRNPAWENAHWAVAPRMIAAWDASKTYSIDDLVSSGSTWYRCISNHTNQAVSNASYWIAMTGYAYQWSATATYSAGAYVSYGGVWYKCILTPTANQSPNNNTYWTATWTNSYGVTMGAPVIYAEGTANLLDGSAIKTQERATVAPAALFPNAAGAATTLTLGGAGTVDSYDGSVASLSAGGVYSTYSYDQNSSAPFINTRNVGYAATLASGFTTGTAINGGTGTVQGYLAAPASTTSPYAPLSSFNGTLKGTAAGTGIDLTRFSRSPYIPDFDVQTPVQHTALPLTLPTTLSLGTPGAPTPSVYYYSNNLLLASTIAINGPVILYINGYLRLNTGSIIINSTGSAEIHFTYFRVYGGAGFVNNTKDPKKLVLLGTIAGTNANYLIAPTPSTNYFYGVIYLPDTTATLGLDIRTGNVMFGAVSAREVTFSSEANLHYDTSLRYAKIPGVDQPYVISEWRELTDATERVVLP